MATLTSAFGTSHTPMLATGPDLWPKRTAADMQNPDLRDRTGRVRSFQELAEEAGDRYAADLTPEKWQERHDLAQASLDRLQADLLDLKPDVLVVVGDDQEELFDSTIQPVMGVFWGDKWLTEKMHERADPEYWGIVAKGQAMDEHYEFDGHPQLGEDIVKHLMTSGFDVTSLASMPKGRGFGHAYGFVIKRLLGDHVVPVIPVLLNTYFPPNQPTSARCYDFGVALAKAIEASSFEGKVIIGASGGLSHFVVNEDLDRQLMEALRTSDAATLRSLPEELLGSGTSEIRNWIVAGGAMQGRSLAWSEYIPAVRSVAGTGCGLAFARWA